MGNLGIELSKAASSGVDKAGPKSRNLNYLCNEFIDDTPIMDDRVINATNFERAFSPDYTQKQNQIRGH